jgi:hypothetical protein
MKTIVRSISRSHSRCGLFFLTIALCWFALSPALKAGCPNPPGVCFGQNTAVGQDALFNVTSGVWNVGVGVDALFNTADGNQNTGVGYQTLFSNTSGDHHTGLGSQALFNNTTGNDNVGVGFRTLYTNTTGNRNTGMGFRSLAFNDIGNDNTAVGWNALYNNRMDSNENTAIGYGALFLNTTGDRNVAVGFQALYNNSTAGNSGNAVGYQALFNSNGFFNNAFGWRALFGVTTGENNVAFGDEAGQNLTTGNENTMIGKFTGGNTTTADNVVCLGAFAAGENFSNRAYIPNVGVFTQNFSAGVVEFVTVRLSDGKLGHSVSSRRYKEDIKPMNDASELIYKLKPVSFRFKKTPEYQGDTLDYGLIAEDVAEIDPKLAIRDGKGQIESLRYMAIYNMMLNEFLKEHKKVEEQQASIAELKSTVALQQKEMQALTAQLKQQTVEIQKVSAQVQIMSKPRPNIVTNSP